MTNYLVDIVYEFTLPNGKHAWAESNSLVPASSEGEAFAAACKDLVDVKVLRYQVHESYGVVRLGLPSRFKTRRDAFDVADIYRRNMNERRAQDEAFRRNMDELLSDDENDPEPQETRNPFWSRVNEGRLSEACSIVKQRRILGQPDRYEDAD